MLPANMHKLTKHELLEIAGKARASFQAATEQMMIDNDLEQALIDIYIPLAAHLAGQVENDRATRIIGVNGAQGSGKSTLCRLLQIVLEEGFAKRVATFSIDDIYLTRIEREVLAIKVHPLLKTRGVPGTHDVTLGRQLLTGLRALQAGQSIEIPVFDKSVDDRSPKKDFRRVTGPIDLVLFEGWCVGASPQRDQALSIPVNSLERIEDPDQIWRRYVNQQLANDYQRLFAEIDLLIMLKVPGMSSVVEWRSKQERKLANAAPGGHRIMDTKALQRFIMHYERLTRAMLAEMPDRADLVFKLSDKHKIVSVQINRRAF
jgi:D-glycerate 3-kinase